MFGKETILVNATIYKKYAGGGYDTKAVRHAFDVPAGTSKNQDKLKKIGMINLLGVVGKDHEIMGEVIATDNEGYTKSVKFNYRPVHEKMLIPPGYSKTQKKAGKKFDYVKAGNKVMAGAKKLNDAFDAFMGGGKKTTTTRKRNTATTKKAPAKTTAKKTTTRKQTSRKTNTKRTTNKKR